MKREAIRNEHEKTGLNHKQIVTVDDVHRIKLSPAQCGIVHTLKAATYGSHLLGFFCKVSQVLAIQLQLSAALMV